MLNFNQPCRIKPLVWMDNGRGKVAASQFGGYMSFTMEGKYYWSRPKDISEMNLKLFPMKQCDSIEDGMAKAEAWYLKRMEEFVEPVPIDVAVERLRESALDLCRELQCQAMEFLSPSVQNAWSYLFDILEGKAFPLDEETVA